MRRSLIAHHDSCNGCLSCVTTCSQVNEKASSLTQSRIYVALDLFGGHNKVSFCRQCKNAVCASTCPVEAIFQTADGYWDVDYDRCIGCRDCVSACPFGAMFYDPIGDKVIKCHTCHGSPRCVEICPTRALTWRDPSDRSALLAVRPRNHPLPTA